MKKRVSLKISLIVISLLFLSISVLSGVSYYMGYQNVKEAVGLELEGCANITTALLNKEEIALLEQGKSNDEIKRKVNEIVDHKSIFNSAYILDLDGNLLVVDNNLEKEGFKVGDKFHLDKKSVEMLTTMKHTTYSDIYEEGKYERISGYAPIFKDGDPSKEVIAINAVDFKSDIITERTWDATAPTIILGFIFIMGVAAVLIYLITKTIAPLTILNDYVKQMAEGDLTKENLKIKADGEIKELIHNFNLMKENLKTIISLTATNSSQVTNTAEEITANAEEINALVNEISAKTQEVASETTIQNEHTTAINKNINMIMNDTAELKQEIDLTSNISNRALSESESGKMIINKSIQQMEIISERTYEASDIMSNLKEQTAQIEYIVSLITSISEQTNLLALNASIEAARAGEHGRGFAVVADEVRKLAEESKSATSKISDIVSSIQQQTSNAVVSINDSNNAVTLGKELIHNAGDTFNVINDSISTVSNKVNGIVGNIQVISQEVESIVSSIDEISETTRDVSHNTQNVAEYVAQQSETMNELSKSLTTLVDMSIELGETVNKFKI